MSAFLNIEEVASRFKRSSSWFYKNYKKLSDEKGFPRPIKLNGYNVQWSEVDVDFWFDTHINTSRQANDNNIGKCYEKLLAANAALL